MMWGALLVGLIAVVAGAGVGIALGGANSDPFETVVKTVGGKSRTVTHTETITKTKTVTETATEEVPDLAGDSEVTDEDDADGDGCSDSYEGPCLAPADGSSDIDCTKIRQQDFNSVGDDPYGLDPNGDSIACDSY
jgi:hypothetical protein